MCTGFEPEAVGWKTQTNASRCGHQSYLSDFCTVLVSTLCGGCTRGINLSNVEDHSYEKEYLAMDTCAFCY